MIYNDNDINGRIFLKLTVDGLPGPHGANVLTLVDVVRKREQERVQTHRHKMEAQTV